MIAEILFEERKYFFIDNDFIESKLGIEDDYDYTNKAEINIREGSDCGIPISLKWIIKCKLKNRTQPIIDYMFETIFIVISTGSMDENIEYVNLMVDKSYKNMTIDVESKISLSEFPMADINQTSVRILESLIDLDHL